MHDHQSYAIHHPIVTRDRLPDPEPFGVRMPAGRYGFFLITLTVEADERTIAEWWRPCWHVSVSAYHNHRQEPIELDKMPLPMVQHMWEITQRVLANVGNDHPEHPRFGLQKQRHPDIVHLRKQLSDDELRIVAQMSTA